MAILLLLAGLFLYALELFVPSAGVLFVTATILVIWSVVTAFQFHWLAGATLLVTVIGLAMVLPGFGFWLWKRSPMGRQMFLKVNVDDGDYTESPYQYLVGEIGVAVTPLRPSGAVEFNGRRVDVVADGGVMILKGEEVKFVSAVGNRIVVRRLTEREQEIRQGKRNLIEEIGEEFPLK
jgi:membrane-bound serine protease (ClpP class)